MYLFENSKTPPIARVLFGPMYPQDETRVVKERKGVTYRWKYIKEHALANTKRYCIFKESLGRKARSGDRNTDREVDMMQNRDEIIVSERNRRDEIFVGLLTCSHTYIFIEIIMPFS